MNISIASTPKHKTFDFAGYRFPFYAHSYNCGHPPGAMSERSLELAITDVFLETTSRDSVVEIGAVTPYYWPYRVEDICDPADTHPLVNIRANYLDVDFTNKNILSISTFEHIGRGDYGIPPDQSLNQRSFEKLFKEADSFLVTIPGGQNPLMDRYLFSIDPAKMNCSLRAMIRVGGWTNCWEQRTNLSGSDLKYEYGAYCLIVISRGTFLENGLQRDLSMVERIT